MQETTHDPGPTGLQGTPEGRLWTAVVTSSVAALEGIEQFHKHGYQDRVKAIRQDYWTGRQRGGETVELSRNQVKERLREANKAIQQCRTQRQRVEWFFFAEDSSFLWICSAMEYDAEIIREEVRRRLKRIKEIEDSTQGMNIRSIVARRPGEETADGRRFLD